MNAESIAKLTDIIRNSRKAVFFGGAGVSTESGLKDYRSEDGIYSTVNQYGVSPEVILSHSFFFQKPDVFYDFYYRFFLSAKAEPNRAHLALTELERKGILKAVITQNIDGLHQKAGSQKVIELHGTTSDHACTKCGKHFDADYVASLKGKIPYCDSCGEIVKPEVVLYEEQLNSDRIEEALRLISSADTLIIGGTSLAVYPAAGFVRYFNGEHLVLINRDETPYDSHADLIIHEKIGEVLGEVMKSLNEENG